MTRPRSLKFMAYFTLGLILFARTVGNWLYQDAVAEEELNKLIKRQHQRGYEPQEVGR